MTPTERIKADALSATNKEEKRLKKSNQDYSRMIAQLNGYQAGYEAGAIAESERAKALVDALEWIQMHAPIEPVVDDVISGALEQWKGKEVGDEG